MKRRGLPDDYEERYRQLIEAGESPKMADLLAARRAPLSVTDREFLAGRLWKDQFENQPWVGRYYRKIAEAHGVSTVGKVYISQMADFPGDPRAWVDSRGDIQRWCEERGYGCTGIVNVPSPVYKDDDLAKEEQPYRVADDIVDREVESRMEENPDLRRLSGEKLAEYKEQVREEITPEW